VLPKVSVVAGAANGQGIVHFIGTMARESTMDKMSAEEKKKSRVSPCFLQLKILKRAFLGDMKQR
jgi:hypothetical protein